MKKEAIQKIISSGNPNDLYAIRFNDYSKAVGYFDNKKAHTNLNNFWQFHLNSDPVNKVYSKQILEVNGDDILYLDKL